MQRWDNTEIKPREKSNLWLNSKVGIGLLRMIISGSVFALLDFVEDEDIRIRICVACSYLWLIGVKLLRDLLFCGFMMACIYRPGYFTKNVQVRTIEIDFSQGIEKVQMRFKWNERTKLEQRFGCIYKIVQGCTMFNQGWARLYNVQKEVEQSCTMFHMRNVEMLDLKHANPKLEYFLTSSRWQNNATIASICW